MLLLVVAFVVMAIGVIFAVQLFTNTTQDTEISQPTSTSVQEVSGVEKETVGNDAGWLQEIKRQHEEQEQKKVSAEIENQTSTSSSSTPKTGAVSTPAPRVRVVTSNRPTTQRTGDTPLTPQERRLTGEIMIAQQSPSSNVLNDIDGSKAHDSSYDAPTFAMGTAIRRRAGALDFLLQHGTVIPCALYSQIISDYQGIVTCRVTQDVYSANGKALLVERGSLLTGSQSVQLEAGKNRVFTTWADIETPNGIAIRIDSLGADRLGASGNEVWIDNHFKERFGGAILLSFLDDAFSALAESASSSNNITFNSSTENASNMAEKALESSINISPTGYTQIGQRINIIVARDIDMSNVYRFESSYGN
ncbi:type IV secretion system protein VirB10 [Vibrio mediterranei]|nr:type IV secretion system protein VirB10 [Vibrio mediterranei]